MAPLMIVGMGNPLLDISSVVDSAMIEKYGLKADDAILTEKEDIFTEMKARPDVEYIPGGATQNSVRVAQWILGSSGLTSYMGCVGRDDSAKILREKCSESGIKTIYQVNETLPTGKCAVLITGDQRSLVTKLDAANHYTKEHLDSNWDLIKESKIFYSAGFFLTVSAESMESVARFASSDPSKTYALNFSAPFIPQFFKDALNKVLPYTDILFCNESEAEAYAESHNLSSKDVSFIAKELSNLPKSGKAGRTVIITQGKLPVILAQSGAEEVKTFEVESLPQEKIVDTNGAGDAFVGGFLAQFALGKSLDVCIKCGIYAATVIIQRSGCTFSKEMEFK